MTDTPIWKRLPIIRHIRYLYTIIEIDRHYEAYWSVGMIPWNYADDLKEAAKIWRGER